MLKQIRSEGTAAHGIRLAYVVDGMEWGHVYLYIRTDVSQVPAGLIEGLCVEEKYQSEGVARDLLDAAQLVAKKKGCDNVITKTPAE